MLFFSYIYVFLFLPTCLVIYHLLAKREKSKAALGWLISASLFFYGWWNPEYLVLIISSVAFNYLMSKWMFRYPPRTKKSLLVVALAGNLSLLGYFKYANFLVLVSNEITGSSFHLDTIVLPLAISFFTLQQIGFVVDCYRGEAKNYSLISYALFVVFFPQLIAGPIVHHRKLIPQFELEKVKPLDAENLVLGFSIFFAGMFKKIAIADQLIPWISPVFDGDSAALISGIDTWIATYAYSFQLYFDFSGYSDMAIGAALMFNIRLPINFNSPYKAGNIREIWRRWHITLSDFIMRYVYAPLGAAKRGRYRTYSNLFIAFVVTGVWHGAGWNFLVFGCLHGGIVVLHQLWREAGLKMSHWLGVFLTFNFWTMALVVFRSPTLDRAWLIYDNLFTLGTFESVGLYSLMRAACLLILLFVVMYIPNTGQIFRKKPDDRIQTFWRWTPSLRWGLIMGVVSVILLARPSVSFNVNQAFIYFQF